LRQFPKLVCFTIDICKTIPYNDVKIKHRKGAMNDEKQNDLCSI
jgi:hypothetical protein